MRGTHLYCGFFGDNEQADEKQTESGFSFMVTGFFIIFEVSFKEAAGTAVEAQDAVLYALNKAKGIFGLYIFAQVIAFAAIVMTVRGAIRTNYSR